MYLHAYAFIYITHRLKLIKMLLLALESVVKYQPSLKLNHIELSVISDHFIVILIKTSLVQLQRNLRTN